MSIRKAEMADFFEENVLFHTGRPGIFPLFAKWGARFVLRDDGRDFAADLLRFAARFDPFPPEEFSRRRLAVHEAVLNALRYGGAAPVLTAWGTDKFMQVGISQKKNIRWPLKVDGYRGTALIRRYASECMVCADKKTLILRFY